MRELKLLCWNVNGIRAVNARGNLEPVYKESPDILCFQETKVHLDQLDAALKEPKGYLTYWNYPERKGYGGVATFTREKPLSVRNDFPAGKLDLEGRVVITEYPSFTLMNIYFPNGKKDAVRLKYKMDFYDAFLVFADSLVKAGKKLIVCGDVNTAHTEIDIARPKENSKVSGFLPSERAWLDKLISHGYVDTFRYFHKEPEQYTWWDIKTAARARNVGWRIDYFFVSENLLPSLVKAFILPEIMGSDHCPVGIILRVA
jgi:exodeoxyribonuclease III